MEGHINLARMWESSNGINRDARYVYLRVKSTEMPGSFTTADRWFVTNKRLDDEHWQVMLDYDSLKNDAGPHRSVARRIVQKADMIEPSIVTQPIQWVGLKIISHGMSPQSPAGPAQKMSDGP